VKRCVKAFREHGPRIFYAPASGRRKGKKLTSERLVDVQTALNQGQSVPAISKQLGVLPSTLHKAIESLRYQAPGEWGKLLGLDRSPEVKTMRNKLGVLCDEPGRAQRFGSVLAKEWMSNDEQAAGTLYIDGHVRVYTGHLTKLPGRPAVLRCDANRRSGFVERVAR